MILSQNYTKKQILEKMQYLFIIIFDNNLYFAELFGVKIDR